MLKIDIKAFIYKLPYFKVLSCKGDNIKDIIQWF